MSDTLSRAPLNTLTADETAKEIEDFVQAEIFSVSASKGYLESYRRAVATGMASMAMAIPLFDKKVNKFKQILFLLLDLSRSMYRIHIPTYNNT